MLTKLSRWVAHTNCSKIKGLESPLSFASFWWPHYWSSDVFFLNYLHTLTPVGGNKGGGGGSLPTFLVYTSSSFVSFTLPDCPLHLQISKFISYVNSGFSLKTNLMYKLLT